MATAYKSNLSSSSTPAPTGHGFYKTSCHLHAVSGSTAFALNDTIDMGSLPANAVVVGVILKAQSQLDSATALTIDVGIAGTAQLWMAAIATVGRAVGVTGASAIATAGTLYKTTGKTPVLITIHAAPGAAVAGVLELDVE